MGEPVSLPAVPTIPWDIPAPWKCPQGIPGRLRTTAPPPHMCPQGSPRPGDPPRPKDDPGNRPRVPPKSHPGDPQHPKSSRDGEHQGTPPIPPQPTTGKQNLGSGQGGTWRIPGMGFKSLFGCCHSDPHRSRGSPQNQSQGGAGPLPLTPQSRRRVGAFTDFNLVLFLETKKKTNPKKEKIKRHQTAPISGLGVQRLPPRRISPPL